MTDFNTGRIAPRVRDTISKMKAGTKEFDQFSQEEQDEVIDFFLFLHDAGEPGPSIMHLKLFRELAEQVESVLDIVVRLTGRNMAWSHLDRAMLYAWLSALESKLDAVSARHVLGRIPEELRRGYHKGVRNLADALDRRLQGDDDVA